MGCVGCMSIVTFAHDLYLYPTFSFLFFFFFFVFLHCRVSIGMGFDDSGKGLKAAAESEALPPGERPLAELGARRTSMTFAIPPQHARRCLFPLSLVSLPSSSSSSYSHSSISFSLSLSHVCATCTTPLLSDSTCCPSLTAAPRSAES